MRALGIYVGAVVAAAFGVAWTVADPGSIRDNAALVIALSAIAALSATWQIRLPGTNIRFTVSHPVVLGAIGLLGPSGAIIASLAVVLGACITNWRRTVPLRLLFNLAAQAVSVGIAAAVYEYFGGVPGGSASVGPLAAATTALFALNSTMVTLAIVLERGVPFVRTWVDSCRWSMVSYYAGMSLAVVILMLFESFGLVGIALGAAPAWMIIAFYRAHSNWQSEQIRRVQEVEALNEALETKVADRTRELQLALRELESTNRALTDTNVELAEASRAKSEFMASMSHELRTPLNSVIGFSELISSQADNLSTKHGEFLGIIKNSGEHLLSLINDILDLSKIEAGEMTIRREATDVVALVRDTARMMEPQATAAGVEIRGPASDGIGLHRVDPKQLREIALNLLSNAVKFTPEGGHIDVDLIADGDGVVLRVADTGIGISPEDQARVFEPFRQVDGSYSRKYHGTGLGLALVKRMMGLHDGDVTLESSPGRGSCFTCRFPRSRVAESAHDGAPADPGTPAVGPLDAATATPPASTDSPADADAAVVAKPIADGPGPSRILEETAAAAGDSRAPAISNETAASGDSATGVPSTPRVLVALRGSLDRRLAKNALRSRGMTVDEATSGTDALELARERSPDAVLVDVAPDGMDLAAFVAAMRDGERTRRAVILVVAAADESPETRARIESAGCDGLLEKPINLARFPREVREHLRSEAHVA